MSAITHQRCFHHAGREAVARCPECHRFFCRECVTEHADRMICATCLKQGAPASLGRRKAIQTILNAAQFAAGATIIWLFFYWAGQTLLRLPSSFHDGSVWRGTWLNMP